jgi:hypothetical protein
VTRAVPAALAAALAAAGLAACGGGGSSSTTTSAPRPMGAPPSTPTTGTQPAVRAPETPTTSTPGSPESKPGGAGDETPAHFDASLTGRGGRVGPSRVSVAPYISVRVLLRSADGRLYQLHVNGKTLAAQGSKQGRLTLPGLKPGQSYTLQPAAGGAAIRIEANAEPGP